MTTALPIVGIVPKLENILVSTDLSEDSLPILPYAGHIARLFGARICLCHIHADVPLAAGLAAPRLYEAEGKQAAEHLGACRRSPALKGVEPRLILASGKIQEEMEKVIAENDIDLVMVGTNGRTGLAKVVLGSMAEEICRVATCPVLTAGRATGLAPEAVFNNILFPTNLSEVSKKTLPYIALLAGKCGSRITVLHVAGDVEAAAERAEYAASMRRSMEWDFGPALAHFEPDFMVASGNVAETVLRVSQEKQAGLIALGIRNAFRPGILVERTAYRIMAGAHCPVLTVL
jgi:nucleotide-binding universal stress UspA family protein